MLLLAFKRWRAILFCFCTLAIFKLVRVPMGVCEMLHFLAMDASARGTMKDAAKCDKHCEWQNSANQKNAERILHSQDIPESMSGLE